jgi:hypothetical protein
MDASGSAFALKTGDNASFKFVNAHYNTMYNHYTCTVDTSGRPQMHIGFGDITGRIKIVPYGSTDPNEYGKANPQISYMQDDNADGKVDTTTLRSNRIVSKGETHTITVTVNVTDKAVKMYMDGELIIDEVMTAEPRFDGLSVYLSANHCTFERLEIYKGIITDVG